MTSLGATRWRGNQNLSQYAEEYKSKYLQYNCEENPQLGMMAAFLASLDVSIMRKVWKRKNLFTTMLELLDIVIILGDGREVEHAETSSGKKSYERTFRGNKPKFAKRK